MGVPIWKPPQSSSAPPPRKRPRLNGSRRPFALFPDRFIDEGPTNRQQPTSWDSRFEEFRRRAADLPSTNRSRPPDYTSLEPPRLRTPLQRHGAIVERYLRGSRQRRRSSSSASGINSGATFPNAWDSVFDLSEFSLNRPDDSTETTPLSNERSDHTSAARRAVRRALLNEFNTGEAESRDDARSDADATRGSIATTTNSSTGILTDTDASSVTNNNISSNILSYSELEAYLEPIVSESNESYYRFLDDDNHVNEPTSGNINRSSSTSMAHSNAYLPYTTIPVNDDASDDEPSLPLPSLPRLADFQSDASNDDRRPAWQRYASLRRSRRSLTMPSVRLDTTEADVVQTRRPRLTDEMLELEPPGHSMSDRLLHIDRGEADARLAESIPALGTSRLWDTLPEQQSTPLLRRLSERQSSNSEHRNLEQRLSSRHLPSRDEISFDSSSYSEIGDGTQQRQEHVFEDRRSRLQVHFTNPTADIVNSPRSRSRPHTEIPDHMTSSHSTAVHDATSIYDLDQPNGSHLRNLVLAESEMAAALSRGISPRTTSTNSSSTFLRYRGQHEAEPDCPRSIFDF